MPSLATYLLVGKAAEAMVPQLELFVNVEKKNNSNAGQVLKGCHGV